MPVQGEGEAAVGLGQLPHPGVGAVGNLVGPLLQCRALIGSLGLAMDTHGLQLQGLGLGVTDVDEAQDSRHQAQKPQRPDANRPTHPAGPRRAL